MTPSTLNRLLSALRTNTQSMRLTFVVCAALGGFYQRAWSIDFEPVRVADQVNITIDMLAEEAEQFVQYGKAIQAAIGATQLERNVAQAETELRRAEDLYTSKSVSLEELRSKQSALAQARKTTEINRAGQRTAEARAELAKYKILDQGQPGLSSYVLPAARAQLDYLQALQTLLARAKEKAENDLSLALFLEENARNLVATGAFPRDELERRTLSRQKAQTGVQTAQAELDALAPAVDAAQRTVAKLQGP